MLVRSSILLLAVILSTACGPEAPKPVTLGDMWACGYKTTGAAGWVHGIYQYSDGSVFTSCQVIDGRDTITSVGMYRADQSGAAKAGCSLVADWDTVDSNGLWLFSFNGSSGTATYSDAGSPKNGMTIALTCQKF